MDTGAAGSIIAVKTLVYQIILVLYSLVMVVWMLPFFQTNISNFSFVTILGLICNSTFILLVLLFCISKRATDMLLRKGIGLLHKLHLCRHPEERYEKIHRELAVFHESSFLLGKSWKLYAGAGLLTVVQIASTCSIPYFIYRGFGFSAAGKCNYGGAGVCIHGERICTAAGRLRRSRRKLRLVLQKLFSGRNHYSRHSRVAYNLLLPEFSRWLYLHLSGGQNAKAHTFRCQKSRRGKGKRTE